MCHHYDLFSDDRKEMYSSIDKPLGGIDGKKVKWAINKIMAYKSPGLV
jgi:hypothetical protein